MSGPALTPEVTWAQRSSTSDPAKNIIYLTIVAPDVPTKTAKISITDTNITFEGHSETKKALYKVSLDLYGIIDAEQSKTNHTARDVEFVLRKKELVEEYWPRLLKESKKQHYLKTDFDKWVDEDEQDAAPEDEAAGGMGGMGGGGMPGMPDMGGMGGMGGLGGDGGFGDIDFSKLGGGAGGGMPDLGDLGDLGGEDDDDEEGADDGDDDEDLPGLEGDAEVEGKGKGKSEPAAEAPAPKTGGAKIEEIP